MLPNSDIAHTTLYEIRAGKRVRLEPNKKGGYDVDDALDLQLASAEKQIVLPVVPSETAVP
jgi:hypothetical protein